MTTRNFLVDHILSFTTIRRGETSYELILHGKNDIGGSFIKD